MRPLHAAQYRIVMHGPGKKRDVPCMWRGAWCSRLCNALHGGATKRALLPSTLTIEALYAHPLPLSLTVPTQPSPLSHQHPQTPENTPSALVMAEEDKVAIVASVAAGEEAPSPGYILFLAECIEPR